MNKKNLNPMDRPVDHTDLNSQKEYFYHLNITSWKGNLYKKFFLYPLLNLSLKGRTLDVGCGLGSFLKTRKNSIGADVNSFNVNYCNSIGLECYLIEKSFPFQDGEFDSVIIDNVLEHIDDPTFTLKEIYRVLKEDGILIVGVPTITGYKSQADHKIFYNEENLKEVTHNHGYTLKKFFYTPFKSRFLENNMNAHCLYGIFTK